MVAAWRKSVLVIAVSFLVFECCAQQNSAGIFSAKTTDTTFKNQGEQENYWAKQYFLTHYSFQHHNVYKNKIQIDNAGGYVFGSDTIYVNDKDSVFNAILAKGLIHPAFFIDFAFWKSKKIRVSNLEELTFLSQLPTVKRFRFLESGHMLNPTVFLIELTNKKAHSGTSLSDFIKDAELTFIADAWIQI